MNEFLDYFRNKKNLVSVLILGILILALPLGITLLQRQQNIKSRANVDPIVVTNAEQRNGNWIANKPQISLQLTSPLGPPEGENSSTPDNTFPSSPPTIAPTNIPTIAPTAVPTTVPNYITFNVGFNVRGITNFGFKDPQPICYAGAPYVVNGSVSQSQSTGGGGANLYIEPNSVGISSSVTVTATSDPACSGYITTQFDAGLSNCKGGCGTLGITDGCTCSGGNPKDSKSCWWRWDCTAVKAGPYTATFNSLFLDAPASDIDADLAEIKRMGGRVIRVFVANDNISDDEAARRLDTLLTKAASYNISVIAVLIGYYGDTGFRPQGTQKYYTDTWNNIPLLGHGFFAGGYKQEYLSFLKTVVNYNKGHANIYAWEPGNELKDSSSPATFINFMKDVTRVIKSIDPSHSVATGMLNAGHVGLSPESLYSQLPDIDAITVHVYDGDRSGQADIAWAKSNNKVAILEEFGMSGAGDRSQAIKTEVNFWKSLGVPVLLHWGFIAKGLLDNGSGDGKYGMDNIWHTDYNALFSLYQSYNQIP